MAGLTESSLVTSVGIHYKNFAVKVGSAPHERDSGAVGRPGRSPRALDLEC